MLQLGVAKELGCTLAHLRSTVSRDELLIWSAFFGVENDRQEQAMEQAKQRAKMGRRR